MGIVAGHRAIGDNASTVLTYAATIRGAVSGYMARNQQSAVTKINSPSRLIPSLTIACIDSVADYGTVGNNPAVIKVKPATATIAIDAVGTVILIDKTIVNGTSLIDVNTTAVAAAAALRRRPRGESVADRKSIQDTVTDKKAAVGIGRIIAVHKG